MNMKQLGIIVIAGIVAFALIAGGTNFNFDEVIDTGEEFNIEPNKIYITDKNGETTELTPRAFEGQMIVDGGSGVQEVVNDFKISGTVYRDGDPYSDASIDVEYTLKTVLDGNVIHESTTTDSFGSGNSMITNQMGISESTLENNVDDYGTHSLDIVCEVTATSGPDGNLQESTIAVQEYTLEVESDWSMSVTVN